MNVARNPPVLSGANSSVIEAVDGLLELMNFGFSGCVTSKKKT
jgi:hypothetical protein